MKRLFLLSVSVFALLVVGLGGGLSPGQVEAAAIKSLSGCNANTLGAIDDRPSANPPLPFDLNFFGTEYQSIFVNNNGNVTFDAALSTFTPFDLTSTSRVIIAPFFGDVDTRGTGSETVTYGSTMFGGRPAFCVNWVNVGYFSSRADKLNSFQLLLVDRGDQGDGDFDIIFNYDQIEWETGNASGGTDGLGGNSARAGYSNGVDTSLELPGSAENGAFLDSSATGLSRNSRSSTTTGRYIFSVRNGVAPTGGSISGTVFGDPDGTAGAAGVTTLPNARVQACSTIEPPMPCEVTSTNANGDYQFTGLRTGGNYFITAFPPSGFENLGPRQIGALFLGDSGVSGPAGGKLNNQNITLIPPMPVPPNVTIQTPFVSGGGTPAISTATGAPIRITDVCSGGTGSWTETQNGAFITSGSMTESAPGSGKYKGMIPPNPGMQGLVVITIDIDCPGGPDVSESFNVYKDPSGNVFDEKNGEPVEGATVTLLRSDTSAGPFEPVPDGSDIMSPSNRTNPDLTNEEGFFRWDVIGGFYQLRIEKEGCTNPANGADFLLSEIYQVPPPVFDLEFFLNCGGAPVTPTPTTPGVNTPTPTSPGVNTPTPTPTTPSGACQEDAFEDNDTPQTASSIALPFSQGGLRSCLDDEDWFSFSLSAGEQVQIDALFSDPEGDIDIGLFDPSGTLVEDSISVTDNEKITHTASSSGTYLLVVALFADAGSQFGNTYGLSISAAAGGLPGDANCDGRVNAIDATFILQFGAALLASLPCQDDADVNGDGRINAIDATFVLQIGAGLISVG